MQYVVSLIVCVCKVLLPVPLVVHIALHGVGECCERCPLNCPGRERLKSQNNISTELEADWQSWWSCKQLPLPINSCYEAALAGDVF